VATDNLKVETHIRIFDTVFPMYLDAVNRWPQDIKNDFLISFRADLGLQETTPAALRLYFRDFIVHGWTSYFTFRFLLWHTYFYLELEAQDRKSSDFENLLHNYDIDVQRMTTVLYSN
jgi:hypothetical protein